MLEPSFDLILASGSPRRASLLRELGLRPRVMAPGIDESPLPEESLEAHVVRLAAEKARAVARDATAVRSNTVILAADTVVARGGRLLGKPGSERDAVETLLLLAGTDHRVVSAVRLLRPASGAQAEAVVSTRVRFAPFEERVARRYVATGEPMDKAGAYGIQGIGALLVESIEGSWTNVVGLPLERLPELFRRVGFDFWGGVPARADRDPSC